MGLGIALLGFAIVVAGLFWFPEFMNTTIAKFIGNFVGLFLVMMGTFFSTGKPVTNGPITRRLFTALILTGPALIAVGIVAVIVAEPLFIRLLGALGIAYGAGFVVVALVRRHLAQRAALTQHDPPAALDTERPPNP